MAKAEAEIKIDVMNLEKVKELAAEYKRLRAENERLNHAITRWKEEELDWIEENQKLRKSRDGLRDALELYKNIPADSACGEYHAFYANRALAADDKLMNPRGAEHKD